MPIILASKSPARKEMLTNAGIDYKAQPANIDEPALMALYKNKGNSAAKIALNLATEKALIISSQNKEALVIGSDQILECNGKIISKAETEKEAHAKLTALCGKTHRLISAVVVLRGGAVLWQQTSEALLTMPSHDEAFITRYCAQAGAALTHCVGAYKLEGIGIQLFEKIEGDYFTILGMPLLPLLQYLREEHKISL